MPSNWFHKNDIEEAGPFSIDQLNHRIANGDIKPDDFLRCEDDGKWVPAKTVEGLAFAPNSSSDTQPDRVVPPPRTNQSTSLVVASLPRAGRSEAASSTETSAPSASPDARTLQQSTPLGNMIGIAALVLGFLWAILSLSLWTISFLLLGTALAFIAYLTICPTQKKSDFWNFEKERSFNSQMLGWGVTWGTISVSCICLGVFGPIGPRGSLPWKSLDKTAVVLEATFGEAETGNFEGHGSAFVYEQDGDILRLFTNSHCLWLRDIAQSASQQYDQTANVTTYNLHVTFPSGKKVPVRRIAESEQKDLDLASLEVDASSLVEGRDYLVVPMVKSPLKKLEVEPGDDVIAVGAPFDKQLAQTQTFGKVSAIRPWDGIKVIQHDATIFHGNSGGPLFLKRGEFAYLIGINTRGFPGQSMSFAISADEASNATFEWSDANPRGAAQLIGQKYGIAASVGNGPRIASGISSGPSTPKLSWSDWFKKHPWVLRAIAMGLVSLYMSRKSWR